ncbi:MAG: Hpt domain-containing protein [Deltaproteobacteria bacterium]|nr:Hpt domain-containing protein [Deltaproteobacteria bacterium]
MREKFFPLGVRGKLLWWMTPIVNLGFLIAGLTATSTARDEVHKLVDASSEAGVENLAAELDRVLEGARVDLLTTARLDLAAQAIDSGDSKNFTWYADELVKSKPQYTSLIVIDLDGVVVGSNAVDRHGQVLATPPVGKKGAELDWVKRGLEGQAGLQALPFGRPELIAQALPPDERVLGFAAPVDDLMGERVGLVAMFVSSTYLSQLLARQSRGGGDGVPDTFAVIVDAHGQPLIRPTGATEQNLRVGVQGVGSKAIFQNEHFRGRTRALASASFGPSWQAGLYTAERVLEGPAQAVGWTLLVAFLLCAITTTFALSAVATRLAGPIQRLTKAVTGKDRAADLPAIVPETEDEVGVLAGAIGKMIHALRDHEVELEARVAARTSALARRNGEMAVLLENVDQGFLVIDHRGQMSSERSKILGSWFEDRPERTELGALIGPHDPVFAESLQLGLEMLRDDCLPPEVVLDQLPKTIRAGERHYAVAYRPIDAGSEAPKLLVVITDRTAALVAERLEREDRAILSAIRHAVRNGAAFRELLDDGDALLLGLESGGLDFEATRRSIHTLKGNTCLFQLDHLGELCHHLESKMDESRGPPKAEDLLELREAWQRLKQRVNELVSHDREGRISIRRQELEEILALVRAGTPHQVLAETLSSLQLEPVEQRFALLKEQATCLARRLGKDVHLDYQTSGVRLPTEAWGDFWSSFVHVLRNALDHGIEGPEERAAAGKEAIGEIQLRAFLEPGQLVIEAKDDGRGINWETLESKAAARGMPVDHTTDLVDAMLAPGVSTKAQVTQLSGRGVGMAAVKEAVLGKGGRVEVQSEPGQGTSFRFVFPSESPQPNDNKGP